MEHHLGNKCFPPLSPVWTARASGVQLMLAGIHRGWLDYFICASASLLPPYQPSPLLPQRGKPQRLRPKGACRASLSPAAAEPISLGVSLGRGSGPGPPSFLGACLSQPSHARVPTELQNEPARHCVAWRGRRGLRGLRARSHGLCSAAHRPWTRTCSGRPEP